MRSCVQTLDWWCIQIQPEGRRESDVGPDLLLGSAQLPGGSDAPALVRALVLPQALAVDEALAALGALVGSLSRVQPVVHLQLLGSRVAFAAHVADEGPVLDVRLVVGRQVGVDAEGLPAEGAGEGPLARVLHLVQFEGGGGVEGPAALRAQEGLLARVDALVDLDVALVDEPLAAVGTRVALLLHVRLHVFLQLLFGAELDVAAAAEEQLRRAALGRRFRLRFRRRRPSVSGDVVSLERRLTLAFFAAFQAVEGGSDLGFSRQRLQVFAEFRLYWIQIVKFHRVLPTKVDFVMRLQISLLVEAAAADGAAVGFLSRVDQLVPLQFVGVRELFSAHRAVIFNLLFGLLQEFRWDFQRNAKHFSARTLFPSRSSCVFFRMFSR